MFLNISSMKKNYNNKKNYHNNRFWQISSNKNKISYCNKNNKNKLMLSANNYYKCKKKFKKKFNKKQIQKKRLINLNMKYNN